jgi:serpin B
LNSGSDKWRFKFDVARTQQSPFRLLDGSLISVPMMTVTLEDALVRHDDGFVGVELRYQQERFSLLLVTTDDAPAPSATFTHVADWLFRNEFNPRRVELLLPRLDIVDSIELLAALDALGLMRGRLSPTALRGFVKGPATISQIIQKTYFHADESGTEAAAATAISTARSPFDQSDRTIAFNKPFVFAIRDDVTGLILLFGYVGRPT